MSDTPLGLRLRRLIASDGPISVATYMALALGDPTHGYYATRDPFGRGGDFITAPEVSQMFGEIVGAWLTEAWRLAGSPSPVILAELGPGRGTLMADILRVAARVPGFRDAMSVHLVETSPLLQERQAATLAKAGVACRWHASFDTIPPGPLLLVANEFFDALPLRQFVCADGAWRERVVGLDEAGRLAFGLGAGALDGPASVAEGAVLEIRPAAEVLTAAIARRLVEHSGAALFVDYGYSGPAFGDTLQAMRGHAPADVLDAPGDADITAHVDFAAIASAARSEGAAVHGPMAQGAFLLALGLAARAERLGADATPEMRDELRAAVDRLAAPAQMGTLFKAMALTRHGLALPPFAPRRDLTSPPSEA